MSNINELMYGNRIARIIGDRVVDNEGNRVYEIRGDRILNTAGNWLGHGN